MRRDEGKWFGVTSERFLSTDFTIWTILRSEQASIGAKLVGANLLYDSSHSWTIQKSQTQTTSWFPSLSFKIYRLIR